MCNRSRECEATVLCAFFPIIAVIGVFTGIDQVYLSLSVMTIAWSIIVVASLSSSSFCIRNMIAFDETKS